MLKVGIIKKGTPLGFPCPHFDAITEAVTRMVGLDVKILETTH